MGFDLRLSTGCKFLAGKIGFRYQVADLMPIMSKLNQIMCMSMI